jgi:hypothetical protein
MAYPTQEIDATINKTIDVAFVNQANFFNQVLGLANKSAAQLNNLTDNSFLQMEQIWQSTAARVLMTDKLAEDILAQRSAMNQPQAAPSFVVPQVLKPA